MATKKRLIEYDAVYQYAFDGVHGKGLENEDFDAIINAIDSVPVVDAVEVVRCKDCRWRNIMGCPYMNFNAVAREDWDYCSDGERRSDGSA